MPDPEPLPDPELDVSKKEDQEDHQVGPRMIATNGEKSPNPKMSEDTNMTGLLVKNQEEEITRPHEITRDQGDDGGEVVEGAEDTVIY